MKKIYFVFLLILALLLAMNAALAESEYTYWTTSDTICTVGGYTSSAAALTIPSEIDGEWYQFDATWDEMYDGSGHDYFALSDEAMRSDHIQSSNKNIVCNSYAANYNYRSGAYDEAIADMQKKLLTCIAEGEYTGKVVADFVDSRDVGAYTLALIVESITEWPLNGTIEITPGEWGWFEDGFGTEFSFSFTSHLLPGDANADGRVNTLDILLVQQYLAGWDVSPNLCNSDMNESGKVELEDLRIMLQ